MCATQTVAPAPVREMQLAQRQKELAAVLGLFPAVRHAFGYGSGIYAQRGLYEGRGSGPMLDFIFAVDDPLTWHEQVILLFFSLVKLGF